MTVSQPASSDDCASSTASACTIAFTDENGVGVLAITGTMDAVTAPDVKKALDTESLRGFHSVIVDLTAVDFLASTGMGLLFAAHGSLAPATRLVIVADGPVTRRPLTLVGISDIVDLYPTRELALASIGSR